MTKTRVLFIAQNMMVSQNRDTVILLGIQRADIGQPLADANLIPGLIQSVFQPTEHRIT